MKALRNARIVNTYNRLLPLAESKMALYEQLGNLYHLTGRAIRRIVKTNG